MGVFEIKLDQIYSMWNEIKVQSTSVLSSKLLPQSLDWSSCLVSGNLE